MHGPGRVGCGAGQIAAAEPRLIRAAHEFEAQMMKELIRPMTRFDGKDEEEASAGALSDFGGEMLGQSLSRAGGFGIANRIIADLSQDGTVCASSSVSGKSQDSYGLGLRFPDGRPISLLRRVAYGDPK
jgi:Rod binding domain-containing protein